MSINFSEFEKRLAAFQDDFLPEKALYFEASDGAKLAYDFIGAEIASDIMLIYHGGGVHRRAGYQFLAQILANESIASYVLDIRGHGNSDGARGHAPSPERVWKDVNEMFEFARGEHPNARLHLVGHSSGAGLLLNACSNLGVCGAIASIHFISPEFGFRAKIKSTKGASFAKVRILPFVLNAFSGGRLAGNVQAVKFDYSQSSSNSELGMLDGYSVNMANAVTPSAPAKQLMAINEPTYIYIAENDELIDAHELRKFSNQNRPAKLKIIQLKVSSHLKAILDAAQPIACAVQSL